ncbi:MAG TPA: exopolysaccharide biosynthesis polyprenyl glycosylphosphotransferase [Streptosporangiaceae bacterium]|nr:exopolysaccharide biosynthesis polyprenyl glycosylphosphotransferase [Streptosporangiaceae bacterium]
MSQWPVAGYVIGVLILLSANGMHRLRLCLRVSDEVPRLVAFAALPSLCLLPWARPASRVAFLSLVSVAALIAMRASLYAVLRTAHRRGRMTEPALIVGTGQTGVEVGQALLDHPDLGLRPAGLIGSVPSARGPVLPVLGGVSEIATVVAEQDIRRIIVCPADGGDGNLAAVLRARPARADVCVVPPASELAAVVPAGIRDDLWGLPVIPLRPSGADRSRQAMKRAFDLVLGTVLLVACAPLLLLLTVVVRVWCGRPVFYRQVRVTRGGQRMTIMKFRTVAGEADGQWTVGPDDCTRIGRWLRATHLDELPQLLNVVRGQMSLVGPRPERPYYASQFAEGIPRYSERHRMNTGLTGWAQVNGLCGDTSIQERARFDNYYIDHWSLWMDLTILARTLTEPVIALIRAREP